MWRNSLEEKLLLSGILPTPASRARLAHFTERNPDWTTLVQRAEQLLIAPLLRFNLAACGCLPRVPTAARLQLEFGHQLWTARQMGLLSEAQQLLYAFDRAGIGALPLKGAALLLSAVYPQPGLRAALDLDVLLDPAQTAHGEAIAEQRGYAVMAGRTAARPRQRLANELNHLAPRRGATGVILELHTRAFHFVQGGRDYTFAELFPAARRVTLPSGVALPLPAPHDLALHLVHHTFVDLQSTTLMLRTLADLYFLFQQTPASRAALHAQADRLGFGSVTRLAATATDWLAQSSLDEWENWPPELGLLFETALLPQPRALADAARLFEYFDFSRQPTRKLGNLFALLLTNRAHLEQLYGNNAAPASFLHYARRPVDLLRKINRQSLHPQVLRRVWQLRRQVR